MSTKMQVSKEARRCCLLELELLAAVRTDVGTGNQPHISARAIHTSQPLGPPLALRCVFSPKAGQEP